MRGRNPSADSGARPGWGWFRHPQLRDFQKPGMARARL